MGSFQIVYDDFSGGQYMGPKSTNLPKNTFDGVNVGNNPHGQLMAYGTPKAAYTATAVTNSTAAQIPDQWIVGTTIYSFCQWDVSSTWTAKMVKFDVANGTYFPSPAVTTTTLTGQIGGKIAYDNASAKFFYARIDGANAGYIRSVTTGGTDASVSTVLGGTGITDLVSYGYRTVAYGSTSKRLYYSNTDLTTWSTSQYYEFSGEILNVLPRSNDLLVVCTTGLFSVVGVLGSSVTIQQLLSSANTPEGMRDAIIVGRQAFFADSSRSGNVDGRIYVLQGTNIQPAFTLDYEVVEGVNTDGGPQQIRCFNTADGQIGILTKGGSTSYSRRPDGTWARHGQSDGDFAPAIERDAVSQMHIARPGPQAQSEYFVYAMVDFADGYDINFYRVINNVTAPTNIDYDFSVSSTASGSIGYPSGTVTLPEYWHNKPFTVKHAIIEWSGDANSTLTARIRSTGILDTDSLAAYSGGTSSTITTNLGPTVVYGVYNTERFYIDNSQKGLGAKVILGLTQCRVKRVILMCED